MSLSKRIVERPVLTVVAFALLAILGLFTLKSVSIDLFPSIDFPMIVVSTQYENAGPESVEKSVTEILESSLVSVSNLKEMTSHSSEGASVIMLEFEYGTNLNEASNNIRDRIDRVKSHLPDDITNPSINKMDADSMPIMRIAVRGSRSSEDLREIAEDNIESKLEQAVGVAQATTSGGRDKIVRVELSQNRLEAYDFTLTEVALGLGSQNLELGGGKIVEASRSYLVRTVGEYKSIDEIANTVVGIKNGYSVKLSDIGNCFSGYEDKSSAVYINGEPGVYIGIIKQSGANSVNAADAVYKKIEEIQKLLPSDVSLVVISDDTEQIRDTIDTLLRSAYQGALLAMLILFLFLRSFKSTVVIGISIPLSIVITLLAMNFAGITLNMMTMTGLILGVGMIVDASIVILENIFTYRERGAKPVVAATLGSHEVVMSVVSGNLTTICVFFPLFFFKSDLGIFGMLFQDMIYTVGIALLSSLLVAVFLVPVLASRFFPVSNRSENPVKNIFLIKLYSFIEKKLQDLTSWYRSVLIVALNHRKKTVFIVLGVLLVTLCFLPFMRINPIPSMSDDSVTVNLEMPLGTPLEDTESVIRQLEKFITSDIRGIKNLTVNVGLGMGNPMTSTDATYIGSITIQLPKSKNQIDTSEIIKEKIRAHFGDFPMAKLTFEQGMSQQMMGIGSDIDIALRSDDFNAALETAKKIQQVMKMIPEISESTIDMNDGLPQVEIEIDRERAYSFGVNIATIAKEINASIDGTDATIFRRGGKEYNVVVMFRPQDRVKVSDLESIFVSSSSGLRVPLSNFARAKKGVGPVTINRENQTRIVHLTASIVTKENANIIEKKIQTAIDKNMVIPDGVSVNFEGSWKEMLETLGVFVSIVVLAIILVYGVMAGTYESFKDPLINLLTIPLLLIGVIIIHVLTGQALSIISAIGIVMLVGIVVNNGIILVDYTNLLVNRGMPLKRACLEAGTSRLRPVLMTTLTTIFGMVPMCFASSGNAALIQPIGLCVVGGLTSSSAVTLLIIPVMYYIFNKKAYYKRMKINGENEQEVVL
ncbi:MAG: efflux RND transporter permease subunit [Spirochaetes bacterium]|jgi:HAE1 family hydrophobic/amphiphilic exporter-1|nr:efflux RND transporter permease subunit [Spirochaetota bacterium]